jgi:hypothetical protein
MPAGFSPEEWVGEAVEVQLDAALREEGWLNGVSEYGLMLRQFETRPDPITSFYPWAQVRSVRLTDPPRVPS